MKRFIFIVLFVLICFGSAVADVVSLNADTFNDKVKEKDILWFVKFCAPWCKHCKNLGSLWEDLEQDIEGEDGVEIGEVDCTSSKHICAKVDIHSYPTFKVFYEGEEIAKYKGKRDIGSLRAFILEEADKAAKGEYDGEKSSS